MRTNAAENLGFYALGSKNFGLGIREVRRGQQRKQHSAEIQGASGDSVAFGGEDPVGAVGGVWGSLFARGSKAPAVEDAQTVIDDLHRKTGQLQVERDLLAGQPAISRLLRGRR